MCDEMTTKFQRLSDELISELQQRDVVVSEMDSKNRFISSILKVQNLRHSVRSGVNGSGIDMVLRNRSRPWSTKAREEKQSGKVDIEASLMFNADAVVWSGNARV